MGPLLSRKVVIKSLLASFRFRCGQEFYTLLLDNKSVERQQKPLFSGHNRDQLKTQDCVSTSRQADLLGSILGNNARCRGLAAAKCRGFHVSTDNRVVRYLPPKETVPTGQFRYSVSLKNLPWTRQYVKVRSLANEMGEFQDLRTKSHCIRASVQLLNKQLIRKWQLLKAGIGWEEKGEAL